MARIDDLLKVMAQHGASDLHLAAGSQPCLRLHGEMVRLELPQMTNEECQQTIFEILNEKQKRSFIENWELDCSYTVEGVGRFRCNVFMQRKGMGGVFRIIPERIKTAEELGLPPELLELIKVHKGLICVTGPTGSGKSTTLAALINYINQNEQAHILTIEDPIEFVHPNLKSLVNQREVGGHTKSFANALKAALREDPDIILVGEMRDLETIQLAITAAETGHLVFGTLHTNNAHKTVDRIIDVFPEAKQEQIRVMLSESLRGVIAQALLPRADGTGRVALIEVLVNTKAIANLIREGKTFQIPSAMQTGKREGMITYESAVDALVARGLLDKRAGLEFLGKPMPDAPAAGSPPHGAHGATPQQTTVMNNYQPQNPGSPLQPPMPLGTPQPPPTPPAGGLGALANRFKKSG
jgi:twitching motility protein PilT